MVTISRNAMRFTVPSLRYNSGMAFTFDSESNEGAQTTGLTVAYPSYARTLLVNAEADLVDVEETDTTLDIEWTQGDERFYLCLDHTKGQKVTSVVFGDVKIWPREPRTDEPDPKPQAR
jgi:hypothetical protein